MRRDINLIIKDLRDRNDELCTEAANRLESIEILQSEIDDLEFHIEVLQKKVDSYQKQRKPPIYRNPLH